MTFAAGIIPYTFFNGTIYFLLGLERSNNKWSGFVGGSETGETPQQTALREFHEETTMSFLKLNDYIIETLKLTLPVIEKTKTGKKVYLWFVRFPPELNQADFHKNQLKTNEPTLKEKSDITWFSLAQIENGNVLYILKKTIKKNFN